jgi:hypothetical protein
MGGRFVGRVSGAMLIALGPLAVAGGLLAGWRGAVGGLAGGLISLGSFRWIARGVSALIGGSGGLFGSALGVGVRHLVLFGAVGAALGSGAAHPGTLLAGLSVLPPVLIAVGLFESRLAR